jgi:hypothetical protein
VVPRAVGASPAQGAGPPLLSGLRSSGFCKEEQEGGGKLLGASKGGGGDCNCFIGQRSQNCDSFIPSAIHGLTQVPPWDIPGVPGPRGRNVSRGFLSHRTCMVEYWLIICDLRVASSSELFQVIAVAGDQAIDAPSAELTPGG